MATVLSAYTPYISPDVPGCPEPLIDDAVRVAAIAFCAGSACIRERIAFNTVTAQDYVVMAPVGGDVVRVYRVMIGDTILQPTRRDDFDEDGDRGQPREYYVEGDNTLRLYPVPDAIYAVVAHVSVKPDRDAATLDDMLFNRYRDDIASGAKAKLMLMANQPWANTSGAELHAAIFNNAIDMAAHRRATGGVSAPLRTRLHVF